jgi:hypothetical protein
MEV